jgi:hypothetical protein
LLIEEENSVTIASQQQKYYFDVVLGPNASQLQVYNASCHPLLQSFFNGTHFVNSIRSQRKKNTFHLGYNCCLLAYGQTGSGKTFTMGISPTLLTTDTMCGILPRASQEVLFSVSTTLVIILSISRFFKL